MSLIESLKMPELAAGSSQGFMVGVQYKFINQNFYAKF